MRADLTRRLEKLEQIVKAETLASVPAHRMVVVPDDDPTMGQQQVSPNGQVIFKISAADAAL